MLGESERVKCSNYVFCGASSFVELQFGIAEVLALETTACCPADVKEPSCVARCDAATGTAVECCGDGAPWSGCNCRETCSCCSICGGWSSAG
jgi:hypothetical protein